MIGKHTAQLLTKAIQNIDYASFSVLNNEDRYELELARKSLYGLIQKAGYEIGEKQYRIVRSKE